MEKITIEHPQERYENIFNLYKLDTDNGDTYYFYNILNKVTLPANLDESVFSYIRIEGEMPLTDISFKVYGTQYLWWLILLANNIRNPIKQISPGSVIKVIKVEYLDAVFASIKDKI